MLNTSKRTKKVLTLFLTLVCFASFFSIDVFAFTPRTTAPSATTYDKSNPYSKGQCTWYAWGRAREILNKTPHTWRGNAGAWYSYNKSQGWYSWGSTPKVGAIMVTHKKGYASDIGHVAVVEKISGDNMTISEYNWSVSKGFDTATLKTNVKTRGKHEVVGYIYLVNDTPSAPMISKCKASSSTEIDLDWNDVSGASKYKIERTEVDGKNKKTINDIKKSEYTDKGLKSGTTYYYKVYAISSSGKTSDASLVYKTYTKPDAPDNVNVTVDGETQITIKWDKVSGAQEYKLLYKRPDKDSKYKVLESGLTTTSFTHKGLQAGTKYCYRAVAVRKGEIGLSGKRSQQPVESEQSKTVNGFTNLSHPSPRNELNDNGQVVLHWNKSTSDAKKSTYHIWRKAPGGEYVDIGNTTSITYTDTSAVSGIVYTYQIRTVNTSNENKDSNGSKSIAFYAAPKIEKAITLTPQSATSMKISWDKPSSETGIKYVVKRKTSSTEYVDVGTTTNTSYVDNNLKTGETYQYYVQLRDKSDKYLTSTHSKSVVMQIPASTVTLSNTSIEIEEGKTAALSASVSPSNCTDKSLTWTSSNTSAAAVSSSGVVTAKAAGSTIITVKTSNGKTATCSVTVKSTACTNHNYGDWITDAEPTCTENGKRHRNCTNSNCTASEQEEIPATGHSYSEDLIVIKEATCTEDGEKARVCAVCGDKTDNEVIEATGHSFPDEWTMEKSATCTELGVESRKCTVCGETETRNTDTTVHEYELTAETETTPDGPGSRTYTCKICGDSYTEEYVPEVREGIVEIGNGAPKAGGTVTVPVTIKENPGITGFAFTVNYDKSVLTPTAITQGELITSGNFSSNLEQGIPASELEQVAVYWGDATNISKDGTLFNITFDVDSNAPEGSYAVSLRYEKGDITDEAFDDVMPDILDNVITIADVIKGDVNQDRHVDSNDGILLSRYLAKWNVAFTENQIQAANVFNDSKINAKDGVRLAQILAGYEIKEDVSTASMSAVSLFSENEPTITVDSFEASAGDYIDVPVAITDNSGIAGFNLTINYDKDKLTPISIEKTDMLASGSFTSNLTDGEDDSETNGAELDCVTASWSDTDGLTEDGTLFSVMFMVNESVKVGETLPIEVSYDEDDICDSSLNNVSTAVTQGEVKITEYTEDEDIKPDMWMYYINGVEMYLVDGTLCNELPSNGDVDLEIDIQGATEEYLPATILVASYDTGGGLVSLTNETITEQVLTDGVYRAHIDESTMPIQSIKIFIWNSISGMEPLTEMNVLQNEE